MTIVGGIDPAMHLAMAGDAAWPRRARNFMPSATLAIRRRSGCRAIQCASFHWQLGVCDDKLSWLGNSGHTEAFSGPAQLDPQSAFRSAPRWGSWFFEIMEFVESGSGVQRQSSGADARQSQHHADARPRARSGGTNRRRPADGGATCSGEGYALAITVMLYARLAQTRRIRPSSDWHWLKSESPSAAFRNWN